MIGRVLIRILAIATLVGFSVGGAGGEVAQVEAATACPSRVTAATLIAMDRSGSGRALACYGGRMLTFDAFAIVTEGFGGTSNWSMKPTWMDPWAGALVQGSSALSEGCGYGPFLQVHVPPRLGTCGVTEPTAPACPFTRYVGHWVRISGHFADPVSSTCRAIRLGEGPVPSRSEAIKLCRSSFVLGSVRLLTGSPGTATVMAAADDTAGRSLPGSPVFVTGLFLTAVLLAFAFRGPRVTGRASARPR